MGSRLPVNHGDIQIILILLAILGIFLFKRSITSVRARWIILITLLVAISSYVVYIVTRMH